MIYEHMLESAKLYSSWTCISYQTVTSNWVWKINSPPTQDSKTLEFTVALPPDAVIKRAWLSMGIGHPSGGAKYIRLDGKSIPSSGVIELEGINAETVSYSCTITYKANGVIYKDAHTHTGVLSINAPTIHVEYTSEMEGAPEIDPNNPGNIDRDGTSGPQLPRLLDANLADIARISAAKVSLDLKLDPLSTATMEIPPGQAAVKVRDFVELFDPNGSVGIFRVSKVDKEPGGMTKAWLKHVFVTLNDDLTIGVQAMEGPFGEVVSSILAAQTVPRWRLGDVELPDEYTVLYSSGYDDLQSAIMDIFEHLPIGYMLDLDTLHYPWVMHLRKMRDDDMCEGRLNRNLSGVRITEDAQDLCTRVYPYGAGEGEDRINLATLTGSLFMDADTRDLWGTITKTFSEDDIFDSLTLQDVATLYLERHKDPLVSVTLDAVNLFRVTGETLDRFYPGRLCRLALPDYDVKMHERVISISYPDVYGKPGQATVTLANKVRTAFDDLANLIREASTTKLIGGTVESEEIKASSGGITTTNPEGIDFEVKSYGNLLAAKVRYYVVPSTRCRVRVDGKTIEGAQDMAQPIDILRYLDTDENGIPTVGEHYVELSPVAANSSVTHRINSTIILKTIERS